MKKCGVRRCVHLFCRFDNQEFVDLRSILAGEASLAHRDRIIAISLIAEAEHKIGDIDLAIFAKTSQENWTDLGMLCRELEVAEDRVLDLARRGLLISDLPAEPFATFLRKDRQLREKNWHPHAALYHFMTKWREKDLPPKDTEVGDDKFEAGNMESLPLRIKIKARGPLPHHFYSRSDTLATVDLPLERKPGVFFDILNRRCTSRQFDAGQFLPLEQLSTVLYYTFGCHGLASMTSDKEYAEVMQAVKRTSPSGGALTPVECYPLVTRVEGLDPGIYHYNLEQHALEQLLALSVDQAESLAEEFTAGQRHYSNAHVLFVLTGRFYRNFWKYGHHKKAYKVMLLETAHLSQTLYLLCAEIGLGAFVTAAVNDEVIDRELSLDSQEEGVILITGCGVNVAEQSRQPEFQPVPFDPVAARKQG